jgi:hypothetical protein
MPSLKKRRAKIRKNRKRKEENSKKKTEKFFGSSDIKVSFVKKFGICDKEPPPHLPAYLDEKNGKDWIAVVENSDRREITFVALDHCIKLVKPDGKQDKCSDGVLFYNSTIIFIELTTRTDSKWRNEKKEQLHATILHFEDTKESNNYVRKLAYIANSNRPKCPRGQESKINEFFKQTRYVLRIENRIDIK